jgi:hypothetical protein
MFLYHNKTRVTTNDDVHELALLKQVEKWDTDGLEGSHRGVNEVVEFVDHNLFPLINVMREWVELL